MRRIFHRNHKVQQSNVSHSSSKKSVGQATSGLRDNSLLKFFSIRSRAFGVTFQFVPPLILLLIITALVFTSGPFSPLNPFHLIPTYADSSGVNVPALSLSTSGDVGFVVLASENGRVSSGKITARVTTDSPVGYTLAIASEGMNGGMAGNLTSDSDSTQAITPISGDITAPIVFDANNCNQWGFAVPSVQTGSVSSGWNEAYGIQSNMPVVHAGNVYKYAGIPTIATTIKSQTSGNIGGVTDSTEVFIAACAGGSGGSLPDGTYQGKITLTAVANSLPGPTITSISPTSGSLSGGTLITITGTNFGSAANPYLTSAYLGGSQSNGWAGGLVCTNLTVISATRATCVTGASSVGTVDLAVDGFGGWYQKTGAFTFVIPFTVALNFGQTGGGNSVSILGSGFTSGAAVSIGGVPCASTTYVSAAILNCVTSAGTAGARDVMVTASGGATTTLTNGFTYMASSGNIQDFSASSCSSMPLYSGKVLTDARDNKQYRIKKMPDNKCWMVDNLAYAGGGVNTYGDVHSLTFANATSSSPWTSSTGLTTRYVTTNNYTGSDQIVATGLIQNTTATLNSGTQCTTTATGSTVMSSACLSYFYNWCAAIGFDSSTTPTCSAATNTGYGTGYTETTSGGPKAGIIGKSGGLGGESKGNSSAGNPAGVNSTTSGSICPAGWRLPVGRAGDSNTSTSNVYNEWNILSESFYTGTLFTDTTSTTISQGNTRYGYWQPAGTLPGGGAGTQAAFGAVASGSFDPGKGLSLQSTGVFWWTSSLTSSSNAANTYISSSYAYPGTDGYNKNYGREVRCAMP